MSKFDFISGLENPGKAQKQKYQIFKVQMGFESVEVCIPFDNADTFEQKILKVKPKSTTSLEKMLGDFGGSIHK